MFSGSRSLTILFWKNNRKYFSYTYNICPDKPLILKRKIAIIFLSISLNMRFGCSKEPSHRDGSLEHP